ncbi:TPA: DUF2922 domain-containing protein [Staphylococcus pseudintermedius]|uniref:DUF2922 domain-containing protein n=1 Tax=Staphylococcus pseudintermedius TaxID=283734 RepID=UPI000B8D7570|nr:DUF2922 domain-containing protein [Staphylococcus pseudintermedius]ASQ51365.1 hypothetical protein SPS5912_10460 [Staphylococcus pseudintermedius]EGQ0362360.1 DUF2922 domain-containing protein [Staphylococcus pseudintermedius]EGQ0374324.1 DUF2922 domain-containing protein [Staphylococcus pseudintermedius]EGQ1295167.1 DUF2922 family protein [Staphylococcus pseudintermedius]EGQ1304302.1 DUF2922 family protein [Staphylococcus pseudintermedius]
MNVKTLEITFLDALQKTFKLNLPNIKGTITKEVVQEEAEKLVALNVLKTMHGPVVKVAGAQVIDKSVIVLF